MSANKGKKAEKPPTITPAKLKGERDWTDGAIKKFLGEPDERVKNPHYTSAAPMRLYTLKRVCTTENTPEFQEWQEKYLQRKESAKNSAQKAVATKKKKTLKKLDRIKIKFPEFESDEELIQTACDNYNSLWAARGEHDKCASPHTDNEEFLRRITLNFLRHACTNYDGLLTTMKKQTGINDAVGILHQRIEAAAIERHPWLDEETVGAG